MAAWPSGLGRGLQSPVRRFDSARRLKKEGPAEWPGLLNALVSHREGSGCGKKYHSTGRLSCILCKCSLVAVAALSSSVSTFRTRSVDHVGDPLGEFGQFGIGLFLGEFTRGDFVVDVIGSFGHYCIDHDLDVHTLGFGDLGHGLTAVERGVELVS